MILLPDTADSRVFVELSSYAADLVEARHALSLAIRGLRDDTHLVEATQHLIGLATIAYCRTVLPSNVRGRLTDHIDLPAHLTGIHDQVRVYRNATVAHSQSELAVTYAIGVLEAGTLAVRDVMAATVIVPLPDHVIHEFLKLIESVELLLAHAIAPVRDRLRESLAETDPTEIDGLATPEIFEKWAHEFDPRTKRAGYPTGHTLYWQRAYDGNEL
jgi:hypothetical protein